METVRSTKTTADETFQEIREELECSKNLESEANCWRHLKRKLDTEDYVLITRKDVERLITEMMQIKEFLPKVLKKEYYTAYGKLEKIESSSSQLKSELQKVSTELERLKKKYQNALEDLEEEKKEKMNMKNTLDELTEINSQQSEYCSRMGAASCTVLWRLSQREDCMETLLAGSHIGEFLQLMCHTIESFSMTLSDEDMSSQYNENDKEIKFVLALCGVATNIAAASYGREFLVNKTDGQKLTNCMFGTLEQASPNRKQEMKIRNLCLKFLYNISINQEGIKQLTKRSSLIRILNNTIEVDESFENKILSIRLLQSLMLESDYLRTQSVVSAQFSIDKMRAIAVNANGELQEALLELINDIKFFSREQ